MNETKSPESCTGGMPGAMIDRNRINALIERGHEVLDRAERDGFIEVSLAFPTLALLNCTLRIKLPGK